VITWSLFRFQLLNIVPVARDLTVESMSDGVMVLDMQNRVVDLNLAAQQVIGRTASAAIGQPAAQILSDQPHLIERFRDVTEANAEIAVGEGEGQRYFDLRISPLHDWRSRLIGRLIVFRDITERRRTEEALRKAEAETRRRLTEQTALREAGAMISSSLDLATVLNYIAEQMGLVIDATSAYICDYKPGARMSTVLAAYIGPQACAQEQMYDLGTDYYLPQDFPNLIEFLRTGQPGLVHRDAPGLAEPERSHMRQFGIQTMLIIPLQIKGQTVGYAELWESRRRREFTAHEIALCQGIAQQAAIAIENARLYDETRHHAADMSVLYTITRMASRSLMLKDALSKALSAALLLLDFEAGAIGLADPADGRLHLMVEQRLPSILSRRLRHGGLENTPLAYAHDRCKRLILNAAERETSPAIGQMGDEMATLGLHTCVCIPLLHQDQSLGVIGLFAHQSRSFSTSETTLLDTIGHQVATAVANARLFQTIADERSRLQALIESNRDGIILMGMNQRMLVANAPAIELLRLPGRPADWTDRPVRDILIGLRRHAPVAVRTTMAEIRRIQKGDEPPGEGEYEVPPRIIHWLNLPVLAGGIPLGRLLVLRDVTQERLLEKMRDDLTRTMVHDLRSPLTTISSSLQLLEQADTLSADQRFMLGIARNSTQKMLHLINNILDVSQLESGRMPLRHEPVSLANLIAETLRTQAPLAADKSLRLESDVSPLLPPAWADVKLIERVLQNLVDNAIRFTPPSGRVRVTARSADEETIKQADRQPAEILHLCVSVSNSGSGIPPELQSRLFQKFATGDQQESGSGLGLAFCKLVVEAHGGRIWAESEPGQATTFNFTLPVAPEAA
jgi:PAS domain S-box-containing protein